MLVRLGSLHSVSHSALLDWMYPLFANFSGLARHLAPADEDDPEGPIVTFCPACARREFGPFGWKYAGC